MDMSFDRATHVLVSFIGLLNGRSAMNRNPTDLFAVLRRHVDDLTPSDLVEAADKAKTIGSELRSLAWRLDEAERRAQAELLGEVPAGRRVKRSPVRPG
jgi:hypothetical protein